MSYHYNCRRAREVRHVQKLPALPTVVLYTMLGAASRRKGPFLRGAAAWGTPGRVGISGVAP